MATPLLTAAMIVRDEAAHLPGCLESIRDVVDEMVIVDTGSSDATVSIAHSFGARVLVHPWRGDFADARNVSLDHARGTWILYIDADERLRPISRDRVRRILDEATDKVSLRVRLRPFVGATPYWEFRLWRSDPRIRFAGVMHEKITPAIKAVAQTEGLAIDESELCLDHVGYEGDQTRKHRRNLPLLEAQLAAEPSNSHNWAHLARVLDGLGRPAEAGPALDRAIDTARENGLSVDVAAFTQVIQRERERGRDVTALIDEALEFYPDNIGLTWHKANAEIDAGRYHRALWWLTRLDADPDMPIEDTIAYRAELFGARSAEARGLCYFRLGRYREAAAAYRQAETLEPQAEAHRLKRVLSEHRANVETRAGGEATLGAGADSGIRWPARAAVPGVTVDVGGVAVHLSASDAVRAAALHSVLGRMNPADGEPDVQVSFGAHRLPSPAPPADEHQSEVQLWHGDDALMLTCGEQVSARVRSGRGELGGHARQLRTVFHHTAPFMLASLLAPHGRFLLHAGAIQRDGAAVLVLGDSGVGKSTLILGALEDGWSVLSDDLALVRLDATGPMVCGIPKPLVVPGEVLRGPMTGWPLPYDPRGRHQLEFESWDRAWRPVRAILDVAHGTSERAEVRPLAPPTLLGLLMYGMLCRQRPAVRGYLRLAMTLCGLPAHQVFHSHTPQGRAQRAAEALSGLRGDY